MEQEKTITTQLDALFNIANEFVEILELQSIKGWFDISGNEKKYPVVSECKIRFYQPSDTVKYSLITEYTHIIIEGIEIGVYNTIKYKRTLTISDLDLIIKDTKAVLAEFKTYSFGSMYERKLLEKRNELQQSKIKTRKLNKEIAELQATVIKLKTK